MPNENEEKSEASNEEEPKLTPLQRVKQQQMLMRKNRNIGAKHPDTDDGAAGGGGSEHKRVNLNRRSGGA